MKFEGSINKLLPEVEAVLQVASNHEERYKDKWLGSTPEHLLVLAHEKYTRIENMADDNSKMEELIDGCVYGLMALHQLKERNKNFKYPSRENKIGRDNGI